MINKTANQDENIKKLCNEEHPTSDFEGKLMETERTACTEFPNGEKAAAEQVLGLEKLNLKKAGLRESCSDLPVGRLTISVR